jgi:O-antigen/teichoic acid export membrane protein
LRPPDRRSEPGGVDVLDTAEAGPKVIRGGATRTVGYGLGLVLSLASAPLLTRHLGVVDYGGYVTVTSLITVVGLFVDAGLTTVGVREYAVREAESRKRLMQNVLAVRLVIAVVGGLVAIAFALVAGYEEVLVAGTALGAVGLVLTMSQHTYTIPLVAELRLGLATAFDLLRTALTVVGIVALVVAGADVLAFFAIPIPVGIVLLVVTGIAIRRSIRLAPRMERAEWRYLLAETIPAAAASTLASLFYRVAIIMMSLIATAEATGYFSASFRVVEAIVAIPSLLVGSAYPVLSRAAETDEGRLAYAMQRLFEVAVILGAGTALVVSLGAGPAIDVLAGEEFEPAVPVLRIQGLALAATFFVALWGGTLWVVREKRSLVIANLAGVASAIVLTALLVPWREAEGAAIAMTCSEVLLAGWLGAALLRARPALRPALGVVPKTLGALVAAGLVAWAATPLPDAAATMLAGLVYLAALVLLRGIPADIWETFGLRSR